MSTGRHAEIADRIFNEHIAAGRVLEELVALRMEPTRARRLRAPHQKNQVRIVLRNCGLIDPESLPEYEGVGGTSAPQGAPRDETGRDNRRREGIRAPRRGGAGFPTGTNGRSPLRRRTSQIRRCNADRGTRAPSWTARCSRGSSFGYRGHDRLRQGDRAHAGYIYCPREYPMRSGASRSRSPPEGEGYLGRTSSARIRF